MNQPNTPPDRTRIAPGVAVLWASAIVLFALILIQSTRFEGASTAYAGNVSQVGDYVILTANAGNNEDILLTLDGRSDQLMVYSVVNGQQLQMRTKYKVADFFQPPQSQRAPGRRRR